MKKIYVFLGMIFALLTLAGCTNQEKIYEFEDGTAVMTGSNEEKVLFLYVQYKILSYDAMVEMMDFKKFVNENLNEQYLLTNEKEIAEKGKLLAKEADSSYMKLTMLKVVLENDRELTKAEKEALLSNLDSTIEKVKNIRSYAIILQTRAANPTDKELIEKQKDVEKKYKESSNELLLSQDKLLEILPSYSEDIEKEAEIGN